MRNDAELLRSYAEKKSEEAFAELVRRHVNLVYSAALRQVRGDSHLAQDIAQSVFHDLARKATALALREGLTGWLYTSTHFAATKMMRGENRRRVREQEAFSMIDPPTAPELEWERIQPVLDEVMHELDERDREAVLLRYFEKRSLSEVGARIGVTENAARMRIERALEKLRSLLAKRGVSSTAAALAATLAAQTIAAAPAGLAGAITASVIATTATSISTGTALVKIMSMTKLQIGVVSAVVVAGVITPIVLQQQTNARLRAEIGALQQQAETNTKLRAENQSQVQADASELERLRKEHAELNRLRGEISTLRNRTQELARVEGDLRQLRTMMRAAPPINKAADGNMILAEGLVPVLSWNNA